MTQNLTYCPHRRSTDGIVMDWRVYRAAPHATAIETILTVVEPENAARDLCGLPDLHDGWDTWPKRRVMAPGGGLNPANAEPGTGHEPLLPGRVYGAARSVHAEDAALSPAACARRMNDTDHRRAVAPGITKRFIPVRPAEGTPDAVDDIRPPTAGGFATMAAVECLIARVCRMNEKLDRLSAAMAERSEALLRSERAADEVGRGRANEGKATVECLIARVCRMNEKLDQMTINLDDVLLLLATARKT